MIQKIENDTASFLILDLARLLRAEFERKVAGASIGVTPSEARTLFQVARHGPLRQRDLADLTGLAAMSVTTCLDRLESAGFVRRENDPDDRRAKRVSVTEAAAPMLAQLKLIGDDVRAITREGIAPHDWDAFQAMLKTARNNHLQSHHSHRKSEGQTT